MRIELVLVIALFVSFSGCESRNAQLAPGFNRDHLPMVKAGMMESEVISILGQGFHKIYHIRYPNGSENNLLNPPSGQGKLMFYTIEYTRPKNDNIDFEVVSALFDESGRLIKIDRHFTD